MKGVNKLGPDRQLRRTALATAVVALFLASTPRVDVAATTTDASWLRMRADPARRIFATLPALRSTARTTAPAATTQVKNCADDGIGSLRQTIKDAGDGDTIDLTKLSCATITLETGAILVPVDNLTVLGPGRSTLAIDGNNVDRVFIHPHGGALTFSGMTVRRGRDRESGFDVAGGGCIASAGYLTLDATTVTACYAGGEGSYGGGIYAYSLTMLNSTLSNNVAKGVHEDAGTAAFGGGAFVYAMDLQDSTVSGNRAVHEVRVGRSTYDIGGALVTVVGGPILNSTINSNYSQQRGGGIAAFNPIFVSNSTLSGNVAAGYIGGALLMRWPSTVDLDNSTITDNYAAGGGGGVWIGIAGSTMRSSIVSANNSGPGHFANIESNVTTSVDGDHNIVGVSNPAITLPPDTLTAAPMLGQLANNGGPTLTHAPLKGSPAIDAGENSSGATFDQRGSGYPRTYGASTDIGAFEVQAPLAALPVPALSARLSASLVLLLGALGLWRAGDSRRRQLLRAIAARPAGKPAAAS
ncbi:MAG: choice-of-anchor Q domain-containing protein [Dokdonella sp.]